MEDIQDKLREIKDLVHEGDKFIEVEDYEKASKYYKMAGERTYYLYKRDENPQTKEVYKNRATQYLNKAKELKHPKKVLIDENGGSKSKKNETKDSDSKLKEQLQGCLVSEKPNVKWEDVAGLHAAKATLKEAVVLPIKFPQLFVGKRKPWKGILLYGPPGTGKSFLAKAAATETGGSFFSVSAANIVSKYMGESERLVKGLFDLARKNKPAVIFLDEIDSVMSARKENENDSSRRLKTEFLIQMQGVGNDDEGILVLGATNIPWDLDPAVRRRFPKKIYIGLPDLEARLAMFKINLGSTTNNITNEQFLDLARKTEGYSGSDIATLTQEAIFEPVRKCGESKFFKKVKEGNDFSYQICNEKDEGAFASRMNDLEHPEKLKPFPVCYQDYIKAIQKIKPTVCKEDLLRHEQYTLEFGQEGN